MSQGVADAVAWLVSILLLAGVAVAVGEGVRVGLARWLAWFRAGELVERLLTDLYLAGATLYVLAVLPLGLFRPAVIVGAWTLAILVGALSFARADEGRSRLRDLLGVARRSQRPAYLAVLVAAVSVLCVELVAANGVPTGNTFDSSVDATFTALLTAHGNVALTLQPVAVDLIAYPQGSTAWFGGAHLLLGWSAVTAPLMVTPLFMALAPLGAFALGRRWLGCERAGALFAVGVAFLVPGTRFVAYGSNDFVLAFPLVLLLAARTSEWAGPVPPTARQALAFGLLTGYSAALNPVGAEWLVTSLALLGIVQLARADTDRRGWAQGWCVAVLAGLLGVVPSLIAIVQGAGSAAGPAVGPGGITGAQFVGWVDPFLFGAGHPGFNPDEFLQVELAVLLVAGASLLVLQAATRSDRHRPFRRWVATGLAAALVWESLAVVGGAGQGWASTISSVTSGGEVSLLLFTVYGLVGLYPLHRALEAASERTDPWHRLRPTPLHEGTKRPLLTRPIAITVALLVLLPGAVATAVLLPSEDHSLYTDFSRVTPGEVALLSYAGNWLKPGDRVLVAPGSAAEFLPAYNPGITLLFPMTGASWRANTTYVQLCAFLVHGTFAAPSGNAGLRDLALLDVEYILVTGDDTVLFPAFDAPAMLASGDFAVVTQTPAGALLAYHPPST